MTNILAAAHLSARVLNHISSLLLLQFHPLRGMVLSSQETCLNSRFPNSTSIQFIKTVWLLAFDTASLYS